MFGVLIEGVCIVHGQCIISRLTNVDYFFQESCEKDLDEDDEEEEEETEEGGLNEEEGDTLEIIGLDENTRKVTLHQNADEAPSAAVPLIEVPQKDAPTTKRAYEALGAVEALQSQLM